RRRKEAPALSSPPKQQEPSKSPGTNHLKPTGTSERRRPSEATTRSIIEEDTSVLPTTAPAGQPGRGVRGERIATARQSVGFRSPAEGVTIPCRSESGSFANATRKRSFMPTRRAIA